MGAIRKLSVVSFASQTLPASAPNEDNLEGLQPRRFLRVPTHAIGVAQERRRTPRACLNLPLRLTRIGDLVEPVPVTLVTKNISSTGIYFLAPRVIEPGTAIELEVALVERPLGRGSVHLKTAAHIVRAEECEVPGWNAYAASFDDIDFQRDDSVPQRFRSH
ncbi:MAG TPA: PilZ domain-containing protein [Candidatus Acidoferrales bacterium]|nr:PilZ domain-containing protein [Candidatus Acidoferrales bacterium]